LELQSQSRKFEDEILSLSSKKSILTNQQATAQRELDAALVPVDFDSLIDAKTKSYNEATALLDAKTKEYDALLPKLTDLNDKLVEASKVKDRNIATVRSQHDEATKEFNAQVVACTNSIAVLSSEITRLKSIKDICPTCHQHIPNVSKPDTTKQEEELKRLQIVKSKLDEQIAADNKDYNDAINEINKEYVDATKENKEASNVLNNNLYTLRHDKDMLQSNCYSLSNDITRLNNDKANYLANQQRLKASVDSIIASIQEIDKQSTVVSSDKLKLDDHISIVSQMNTLVKRDFRGFLLTNVIDFINSKSKEYCSKIFNTDDICFVLDGNAIDIRFCNKEYENLSGGEKQRVDLIVQFAIRDMMCTYLGFSSNILVLDEITDALDAISCDKVINFITTELSDIESVFIISHHSDELMLPSECEITVEKDENGVSKIK
jgi:DNA repair exonuclease SbcCD ATPase subunit